MAFSRLGRASAAIGLFAAWALLSGCAAASSPSRGPDTSATHPHTREQLTVFAAASLEPAFEPLGAAFTAAHPDVTVTVSYDGSSVLATQILSGAPADVFASADEANMAKITEAGLNDGDPAVFAASELVIAVAPGDPFGIGSLADLTRPSTDDTDPTVVICAAEVPCGAAAQTLLQRAGVALAPASEEQNVTAVLTRVRSGEADAGLVYASDVLRANGEVEGVAIAGSADAAGSYLAVPLQGSARTEAAAAFVEFLQSTQARALMTKLGFRAP